VSAPDLGKVLGRIESVDKNLASMLRYIQDKGLLANHTRVDPGWAVPRGRVINVFVIIEAQSELLIRHEGGEDVSTTDLDGSEVPVILHEKLVSAWRRHLLEILRHHYDRGGKAAIAKILGKDSEWAYTCGLRPQVVEKGKQKSREELIGGLCGECPNCTIFGFAVREEGMFNVKSRVEGDAYFAIEPVSKSVVVRTFNAVDEVTKTTFIEREEETRRTGALFRLSLVRTGTLFVGKVAMRDLSVPELLLSLYSLATVPRVGGYKSDFGRIKIYIPAVVPGRYEVGSGYEAASKIKSLVGEERRPRLQDVWPRLNQYVDEVAKRHGFDAFVYGYPGWGEMIVRALSDPAALESVILSAWEASKNFIASLGEYVKPSKQKRD